MTLPVTDMIEEARRLSDVRIRLTVDVKIRHTVHFAFLYLFGAELCDILDVEPTYSLADQGDGSHTYHVEIHGMGRGIAVWLELLDRLAEIEEG